MGWFFLCRFKTGICGFSLKVYFEPINVPFHTETHTLLLMYAKQKHKAIYINSSLSFQPNQLSARLIRFIPGICLGYDDEEEKKTHVSIGSAKLLVPFCKRFSVLILFFFLFLFSLCFSSRILFSLGFHLGNATAADCCCWCCCCHRTRWFQNAFECFHIQSMAEW